MPRLKLGTQFTIVVNLPVKNEPHVTRLVAHRLVGFRPQIDDPQSAKHQVRAAALSERTRIRTPMAERAAAGLEGFGGDVALSYDPGQSTHLLSFTTVLEVRNPRPLLPARGDELNKWRLRTREFIARTPRVLVARLSANRSVPAHSARS